MDDRKRLARLLRALADLVDKFPPEKIAELASGQLSLVASAAVSAKVDKRRARPPAPSEATLRELAERLRSLSSRAEGDKVLADASLSKRDLERLARAMSLPVTRNDNGDRLREKVIEASIGSRLISSAIRGGSVDTSSGAQEKTSAPQSSPHR
ncbi:MAG TPA: hypothetical protein VMB50_13425 [Myxococcales bacterium]|nr:hypothetical protein [Myxococcales bacterium]